MKTTGEEDMAILPFAPFTKAEPGQKISKKLSGPK
jgi:hypothetical protein